MYATLKDFVEVMNEEAHTLMKKIEASNGNDLDLGKAFSLYALDTICKTAMGESVNAQTDDNSEYVDALKRISELIQIRSRNPWMRSNSVFRHTKTGNEHDRLLKSLHSFTKSVIMNRMEHQHLCEPGEAKRRRMAFLDVLLNAETHDGEKLSASDIQEEVDTFMFEGHDTTACAMIWTAHLIGLHPCVQERAQAEIDAVFVDADRALTAEDLKKMTYLEQVIKESLRMFPAVPIYTRTLSEDASFDDHVIPRGAAVRMDPYTIHHDPEFWPDPERFDPERFSKENSIGRHPFSFIPFSAGPRNCIGQKFAMQELKVVFSHLLRRYTLTSLDREETVAKTAQLVLRPVRPLQISVNKRC